MPHSLCQVDEKALLERCRDGDRLAAERLVDRTWAGVYRALFRLTGRDAELATDLTQETYYRAWSALAGFDGRSRFATWLYRIAYNTWLNHARRPRRFTPLEPEHLKVLSSGARPQDEVVIRRQQAERLRRAVMALDGKLRFAVTARFWGRLRTQEIARLEGVSEVSVRKRLREALRLLSRALKEEGA